MRFWPKEFIFRLSRELIFGTSFIFTLTALGDYYIFREALSGSHLVSGLMQGFFLAGLMIVMDWKDWKGKLWDIRMETFRQ